jgi:2-polyprenyl-3-methyl-5-hydroxy-6-metoxy-1,4-benzoquinol methylase
VAISKSDVVSAYRLFLGREPESDQAIASHLGAGSPAELRRIFLDSEEFQQRLVAFSQNTADNFIPLTVAPNRVEVQVEPKELRLLLERIGHAWTHLGATAPLWSVLTDPKYVPGSAGANVASFYESGLADIDILQATLQRCAPAFDLQGARVIEHGCGVGRVTVHLAKLCTHVAACDISEPHLLHAKKHLEQNKVGNVALSKVTIDQLQPEGECDLWFSRIVLQHNPPPVIAEVIRQAFLKVSPGGVAIFQVPSYRVGYEFSVTKYLESDPLLVMEMHAIPQFEVFTIAQSCGMTLREVREDNSTGAPHLFVSNSYCFTRAP